MEPILRRTMLTATLVALTIVLFACVQDTPPGVPGADVETTFSTQETVSAVQVQVTYDPAALQFVGVHLYDDTVFARPYDDGSGALTVALVSTAPLQGDVLTVAFDRLDTTSTSGPVVTSSVAYTVNEEPVSMVASARSPGPTGSSFLRSASPPALAASTESIGTQSAPLDLVLQPSFADHRLGDATADDAIDVLDVLRILKIATGAIAAPSDFERYHGDLTNDGAIDTLDILSVLDKAVDPTLPAQLHVAPRPIYFDHVDGGRPVLVNNAGNQSLSSVSISASGGVSFSQLGGYGISGHSAAYGISVSGTWSNEDATFASGSGGSIDVAIGNVTILIAGQSNAAGYGLPLTGAEEGIPQVRMFGNDYVWKEAYEPVDDETGQVDTVSLEGSFDPAHSFGVRLGKEIHAATADDYDGIGRYVYLIPSARQGSVVNTEVNGTWRPASNRLDRSTLFGSANYRSQTSAGTIAGSGYDAEGGPVSAIAWYQGETDSTSQVRRDGFIANTDIVMDAFASELDNAPVLYVQLAANTVDAETNDRFQSIRERQRLMETGVPSVDTGLGSPQPRPNFHMVVAHDLPKSDNVHLSAEGQRMLGERLALAYREHVMGESVDGTGPRLQAITLSGNVIKVDTDRVINDHSSYDGYFHVALASAPGTDLAIAQIRRDPGDATAVQITLSATPSGPVVVEYKPDPSRAVGSQAMNVVKDASSGLPLPAFGNFLDQ